MSPVVALLCSRRLPQVAALALISFAVAGCSGDMSTRVSQDPFASKDPFSNPFSSRSQATGSVPTPQVERREMPQYSRPQQPYQSSALQSSTLLSSTLPPTVATPQTYPAAGGGVSGGGRGLASYAPPSQPNLAQPSLAQPSLAQPSLAQPSLAQPSLAQPSLAQPSLAQPSLETTGTVPVPPRPVAAVALPPAPAQPPAHAQAGSTTIIVGTSDTLDILAQRYHVTPAAILAANGYKGPRALSPGQQLIVPHPAAVAAAPAASAPASRPVAVASAASSVHVVNPGDTLMSIAHRNHVSVAELARANNLDASAKLKLGMRLNVPNAKIAAAAPVAPAPVVAAQPAIAAMPAASTKLAAAGPQQSARLAQASPPADEIAAEAPAKASEATGTLPTFRWPVRGKVITTYGAKTNGKSNDGINLAVPEGTPVKAAEDGVVAYSGNELKGYGNLVLVRHSNGYVTAYAHASELLVKRGDTIKRGQVIAKSGQSGEVGSPQLHFEIRKGSSPVDPLQFLNGA
jgi:murein DD-endopeptidase MepM/ murein hydrolase activator NlpD